MQPERRGASWQSKIRLQRKGVIRRIQKTPSLAPLLVDRGWLEEAWVDATREFERETGILNYPGAWPWTVAAVLTEDWMPPEA